MSPKPWTEARNSRTWRTDQVWIFEKSLLAGLNVTAVGQLIFDGFFYKKNRNSNPSCFDYYFSTPTLFVNCTYRATAGECGHVQFQGSQAQLDDVVDKHEGACLAPIADACAVILIGTHMYLTVQAHCRADCAHCHHNHHWFGEEMHAFSLIQSVFCVQLHNSSYLCCSCHQLFIFSINSPVFV